MASYQPTDNNTGNKFCFSFSFDDPISAVCVTRVELLSNLVRNFERSRKETGHDTDIFITERMIRRSLRPGWTRIRELLNANHANHYSVTFGIHTPIIRNPFVNFIPSNRVCPVTPEREKCSYEVLMDIVSKLEHWRSIYVIIKQFLFAYSLQTFHLRYKTPVKARMKWFLPSGMNEHACVEGSILMR